MSLNLPELTADVNAHQNLPDQPTLSANELKQAWDQPASDIKTYLNNTLIPQIESQVTSEITTGVNAAKAYTDSAVGGIDLDADNIDYDNTSSGLTADNVQDAVDELKTANDTTNTNVTNLATALSDLIKTQTITISDTTPANFRGTIQGANLSIPSGYSFIGIMLLNRSSSPLYVDVIPNVLYNGTNYLTYVNFINHEGRTITTTVKLNAIYLKN